MNQLFHNAELQSEFSEKGIVKVPMLSAEQVAHLLREIGHLRPADNFDPGSIGKNIVTYHCSFLDENVDYKRRAYDLIREFFEPHIQKFLPEYRVLNCNFYVKPPGTGRFTVHQNWPMLPLDETSVTIWCPLVDTEESNGALQVVEGSHKIVPHIEGPGVAPYFAGWEEDLIEKYLRPIPMRSGEAVIFDDSLLHWSAQNDSDTARIAIQILCVPSKSTPCYFHLPSGASQKKFEMLEVDSDFFIERSVGDMMNGPQDLKRRGFYPNRNRALTLAEFDEKLRNGAQIRQQNRPSPPSLVSRFRALLGSK